MQISASIQPHASRVQDVQATLRAYRRVLTGMDELPTVIEEVSALMQIRGYGNDPWGNAFASDVLRIEVTGPTGLNLTVVDLPGLILEGITPLSTAAWALYEIPDGDHSSA